MGVTGSCRDGMRACLVAFGVARYVLLSKIRSHLERWIQGSWRASREKRSHVKVARLDLLSQHAVI